MSEPQHISKTLDLSLPEGVGRGIRDLQLILLGMALVPQARQDILQQLSRPLPAAEIEGLFQSVEGDPEVLKAWLEEHNVTVTDSLSGDILRQVNTNTRNKILGESCVKALHSVQLGLNDDAVGYLENALEKARELQGFLKRK